MGDVGEFSRVHAPDRTTPHATARLVVSKTSWLLPHPSRADHVSPSQRQKDMAREVSKVLVPLGRAIRAS